MTRKTRFDALPENMEYQDRGCSVAPRCLSCPLPECRYDRWLNEQRRAVRGPAIAQLAKAQGIQAAMERFEVSKRTVYRALEKARPA